MSRDLENGIHKVELEERDLISKLRDKDRFEEDMEKMRQEIATYLSQLKVCYYLLSNSKKLTQCAHPTGNRYQDLASPGSDHCFTRGPSTCSTRSELEDQ